MPPADQLSTLFADAKEIALAAIHGVQMDRLLAAVDWWSACPRPLEDYPHVRLLAIGKGAQAMAEAASHFLGDRVIEGLVIAPTTHGGEPGGGSPLRVVHGDHPLPGPNSTRAAAAIEDLLRRTAPTDLLVVLLSGGGTALMGAFPTEIPPADGRRTFELLLHSGADIHAMNVVRKQLTRWGGGKLARAAPCDVLTLIVSDVPGNDLSIVASGPTVPDATSPADARAILKEHDLWARVPESVRRYLSRGRADAGGSPHAEESTAFARARSMLIGTNRLALEAAATKASALGYVPIIRSDGITGEAREVGHRLATEVLAISVTGRQCLLWGGETTVTVRGQGRGGRNQELALGAGIALAGSTVPVVFLSLGTDGRDGPTDAAGAWVTQETIDQARERGLEPAAFLDQNNAYQFFQQTGTLFITGPTDTNVMDIQIALLAPPVAD